MMKHFFLITTSFVLLAFVVQSPMPVAEGQAAGKMVATFAGGCFWCTEADFEKVPGVTEVISGYAGGDKENPTYEEVSSGKTKYFESVQVFFDPAAVSYSELLEVFWKHVDPTDPGGQFVDRGPQYRSAIFYHDEQQKQLAEASKKTLAASGIFDQPIVTEIKPVGRFYVAEEYHQDYYKNNPLRYRYYRYGSGRDQFLEKAWEQNDERFRLTKASSESGSSAKYGKPDDEALRSRLTPLQYRVTQQDATEAPFRNEYWDNKAAGIYVDVVSGEPLFSSLDKYKSGTGWPSFTKPLAPDNIIEREDRSWFAVRTELRSKHGDSHLGHLFEDGPKPTGLRYCINSAALRFIAANRLETEGYKEYLSLFE